MKKIKAIIFDYDGVIAESVNVKTEAFAQLYCQFGKEIVKKVIEHHKANGGMSRFQKFKIYHEEFLGQDIDQEKIINLANEFSKLVLQKVIESPYVFGAYEFISSNYNKYDFYISTGTPTEEIKIILDRKNLSTYFKEVFGSPEIKEKHVQKIIEKYNYSNEELVFIGDAITDRDAARNNGLEFIGRVTTTDEIKKEKYIISNLFQLEKVLCAIDKN